MHIAMDNRVFKRAEGKLAVRYSPLGSNGEFCTTTKDISGGGMRLTLLKKLKPGTVLDLEIFKYNTDINSRCRGRVVWVEEGGVKKHEFDAGIEFIDKQSLYINNILKRLNE